MLLEALAVLGALGGALDAVNQRLSVEIFTLVESVISDVHERAEFVRRGLEQSNPSAGSTGSGGGIYVFVGEGPSALRLAALEGAAKKADHEILRDLCWTLYSKLDAVVQGLRVVSEVSERIASVSRVGLGVYLGVADEECRGEILKMRRGVIWVNFSRLRTHGLLFSPRYGRR
jgi:exocyst complex component 4